MIILTNFYGIFHNLLCVYVPIGDIIDEKVQYVLKKDDFISTADRFIFSVEDTKPNKILNNIFKIEWTRFKLNSSYFNVSESSGFVEIPVIRTGSSLYKKVNKIYKLLKTMQTFFIT